MRCLITGATGFVGPHLANILQAHGHTVIGTCSPATTSVGALPFETVRIDVGSSDEVLRLIQDVQPERVYHLAAQSSPRLSLERPAETFRTNLGGTLNLLLALRQSAPNARILLAGSIGSYGRPHTENVPIPEEHPFAPDDPYASSKAAADLVGYQWWTSYGLHVVRARASQHTGPGQSPDFVCSDFARQIAAIDAGQAEPTLHVGDISVKRDFCDVRDVVQAYESLLEKGHQGQAYNVGSGKATALRDIIDTLLSYCRVRVGVISDEKRLRPGEPKSTSLNIDKIRRDTGWSPSYDLRTTLHDLYVYWQNMLAGRNEVAAD